MYIYIYIGSIVIYICINIYVHIYLRNDKKFQVNDLQLFQIYFYIKHEPTL